MVTAIVVALYALVTIFDFVPIAKTSPRRESLFYLVCLTATFVALVLYTFGISVPGPTNFIMHCIERIFGV
jgi:hypothetical protein